jgi:hypothetical protein
MAEVGMIDLIDELADAVCSLSWTRIDWLCGLGVPRQTILAHPLMIGVAKVQTSPDGFYEPGDDGTDAVIIAEGRPAPPIWDGLDDLIAFQPEAPGRWWRRRGEVKILGGHNLRHGSTLPVIVHENPLSFLRGGARGVCVIDWRINPEVLVSTGPLEAESKQLESRLRQRAREAAAERFSIAVTERSSHAA